MAVSDFGLEEEWEEVGIYCRNSFLTGAAEISAPRTFRRNGLEWGFGDVRNVRKEFLQIPSLHSAIILTSSYQRAFLNHRLEFL
ncbi:hypothetical protein DLM75_22680, partial [Leptospira stimsonii]